MNNDGCFYTSTVNAKTVSFATEEEMDEYIELHMDEFKTKYPNIVVAKNKTYVCIGKCKKLENNQ